MNIPIAKPYFTDREKEMVLKPLESGWVVQGPFVAQLENDFASFVGARHAVATSSCTTAQFIASRCINLAPGDEVLVPAFTWISTANAAEFVGAKPIFVDVEPNSFNIDPRLIEQKITSKTKAIFPVHLFGLAADMSEIQRIACQYNLRVVEDAACSLGGKIGLVHTGIFGDCGCFSMHARKSVTTGEGGMLVTNSDSIAAMARSLRDHGASHSDLARHSSREGFLLPEFSLFGYNFRLTDIQAAVGVAQMEKLEYILRRRTEIADVYRNRLGDIATLALPKMSEGWAHAYQSFVCLFKPQEARQAISERNQKMIDELSIQRNDIMRKLQEKGIATRQGTHAVHIQKYYAEKYSISKMDYPGAYAADRLSIALPLYVQMTQEELDYVIHYVREIVLCAA